MPEVTNMKGPTEKQTLSQGDKKAAARSRAADDDPKDIDADDDMMPLPDYLLPVRQTMSGNFRSYHEEHLVSRLMTKWNTIKDENLQTREQARRLVRKIAVEELTKDWMTSDIDAEIRSFMIDNILPTLVLGIEKLLVEVDKRNLVETNTPDNNFNPLNFLAQYLMRNNPKYCNYAEASPYMRGLRGVSEQLKLQLLSHADNKLMHTKILTRARRQEREAAESVTAVETQRRIYALQQQFIEWGNGKKIELALVQNALLSFVEMVSQMPQEIRANIRLSKELDPTDDTGKGVHQTDFVEHLMPFVTSMTSSAFDMLLSHLSSCAKIYRYSMESSGRKTALLQLFKSCDYTKVGLLSRHRILQLLTAFYNRLSSEIKSSLRDPGQWPIREISELEDVEETCGLDMQASEDFEESKAGDRDLIQADESNETINTESTSEAQDGPLLSSQDELRILELSSEVIQKVISDAQEIVAAADGSLLSVVQEHTTSMIPQTDAAAEEEDGSLVKAVSAGSRMIDRGIAFVDRARLDNWTGTLAYSSLSQSQLCVFNEYTLNGAQFVQLIDTFLNMSADSTLFNQLLSYIKEGYVMAEDEMTLKIMKERLTAEELQRKTKLNRLFDIWDNEGSGFLNCDEVTWIVDTYKDLREQEVAEKALVTFREKSNFSDDRFTKHEFRDFLMSVVELLPRGDTFDMFIDFLIGSIALSYAEQARGDARKKWLQQMIVAAETSGSNMEPVYKSLFDAITKDAEQHGDDKSVSISISLLERNLLDSGRGSYLLHYTAATPDHAKHVLGQVFYKDMKGISFAAVSSGRPIHVPKISKHGNIHFWDPEKNIENTKGAFIVIPLKDKKKRVFGILSIDTINDSRNQKDPEPVEMDAEEELDGDDTAEKELRKSSISCIFTGHEIQFYQGVAKAFSIAYHLVNVRQKMMQTSEHALAWIVYRCPHIQESTLYLVESTRETMDIVLRKMMVTQSGGSVNVFRLDPPQLERKDNFFKEYLFKCADSSELVAMTAYGELHLVIPLRNNDGQTVIVYDVNLGSLTSLPKSEMFEMTRTLQLLQEAYKEITLESQDGVRVTVLKGDQMDNDTRTEVLFGRLMLLKLRQSISRLDASAYAELWSADDDVTEICHPIVKAVLCLLQPDLAQKGVFEDWQKCQLYVGPSTGSKIVLYDPTEHSTTDTPMALIDSWLTDISYEKIAKPRLLLIRHLYNWVWISLLLIKSMSNAKGTHQLNPAPK